MKAQDAVPEEREKDPSVIIIKSEWWGGNEGVARRTSGLLSGGACCLKRLVRADTEFKSCIVEGGELESEREPFLAYQTDI